MTKTNYKELIAEAISQGLTTAAQLAHFIKVGVAHDIPTQQYKNHTPAA